MSLSAWREGVVQWFGAQLTLGMRPGLSGARLRCQTITNATPALVLLMSLLYLGVFSAAGVPALVRSCLLELPISLIGIVWFRAIQRRGGMPSYWQACLVCQATVLTGIFGGQGTAIDTHYYFLFFCLTAPLVVPVADRRNLALISLECLAAYLFFEIRRWPAAPGVSELPPGLLSALRLSVVVGCSAILFAATLLSEQILQRLEQRIVQLANTDALTGLANRRHFHSLLGSALARSARSGSALSLALVDIDHFKSVNDLHGHEAGDEVLQQVACLLDQARRQGDHVARIGGEEFAVIMEHASLAQAQVAMERMRQRVAERPLALDRDRPLQVTVSIGVAEWDRTSSEKTLMARVDHALYAAKGGGRNRVCLDADALASTRAAC